MPNEKSLAPGLLLAAPRLNDPNFERTVVLLAKHDAGGALGWVLNGEALLPVGTILRNANLVPAGVELPNEGSYAQPARLGGPVMPGAAWVLYRKSADGKPRFEGEHDVGRGYVMTSAGEAVEAIARLDGPEEFFLLLGYAGWGPEQVEGEIRAGAWLPADVPDAFLDSMSDSPDAFWNRAYSAYIGVPPMAFTSNSGGSA
jgi:putative transcriptional regulator